jgi:hypothetical protein
MYNTIIIIISYTDIPIGAPVLLLLNTKGTVSYRPDKSLYRTLKTTIWNLLYYKGKELLYNIILLSYVKQQL